MRVRGGLIAVVAALAGGIWIGTITSDDPAPPPPAKVITKTKEVVKEVEVDRPVMPESCKQQVQLSLDLQQAIRVYEQKMSGLEAISNDSQRAIGGRDYRALVEIQQRQIRLAQDTLPELLKVRDLKQKITDLNRQCIKDTPE